MVERVFQLSYDPSKIQPDELQHIVDSLRKHTFSDTDFLFVSPSGTQLIEMSLEDLISFRNHLNEVIYQMQCSRSGKLGV